MGRVEVKGQEIGKIATRFERKSAGTVKIVIVCSDQPGSGFLCLERCIGKCCTGGQFSVDAEAKKAIKIGRNQLIEEGRGSQKKMKICLTLNQILQ